MLLLDDLDRLRADLTGVRARQWRRLHEQCDWYRMQEPPREHPTASITYFGPAAANLSLAYRLTGQHGYLEEAWRWISTCAGYEHWGKAKLPDHDLDAGWLLHGLSLAYSWLGDDLGIERRAHLREKLELQGERLYEFAAETEGSWWSSSYWQNHNWICYAGLATAGYALGREDWTARARDNFDLVLSLLPADGSDSEGVVYWRYGVPWLAVYLDLLQHTAGEDLWASCSFLANTMTWRLHQCLPGFEENIDHGDCHDRRSGHSPALYYRLASAYGDGRAQWMAETVQGDFFWREAYASGVKPGVMPEAYQELLWYDPSIVPEAPFEEPRSRWFPDLGQLCTRTSWDRTDATVVSFKSAPGGGNGAWDRAERFRREQHWETLNAGHHHPDAGAFVVGSHGALLAVDDGYASRKRAANHNLITVDGHGWASEDRYHVYKGLPFEARPTMTAVLAEDGFVHGTADTAAMFDPALGVRRIDRSLVVTPLGRIVMLDQLAADTERRWGWLLHTDWPAEVMDDRTARIASGPGSAWVTHVSAKTPPLQTVTEVDANPTSSTPSLRITRHLHTLTWETAPTRSAALWTVIEPGPSLVPEPSRLRVADRGWFDFGDEQVVLPESAGPAGSGLDTDARAVIVSGQRIGVVSATRLRLADGQAWEWSEPWTGVLGHE